MYVPCFSHETGNSKFCYHYYLLRMYLPRNMMISFSSTMPKRKGRRPPKGSSVQKMFKENAIAELAFPNGLLTVKVEPDFREEQEAGTSMPKKTKDSKLSKECPEQLE
ncbi:hypothetical protein RJT34_03611 [Clitoria ternatea]|uniref:Uncharacterized protein n=1 Tax=Clitoria ternatea TaxID=43366 RepID=A0AAN9Q2P2_CLITE